MMNILRAPIDWLRRMYDWVIGWGKSKHSKPALFVLSLAEASFFPVPPDPLLIALCMGSHRQWFRFALICSAGSVIGGMLGYYIGYAAFELIGAKVLGMIGSLSGSDPDQLLQTAQHWFNEKEVAGMQVGAWAVGIAGFTPIPYKVFTIAAGFFEMNFGIFVLASVISRSARFFAVAGAVGLAFEKYGNRITDFIDRYFNLLAFLFVLLLLGGFSLVKLIN
ncbi:MAG: YqaA family protein [candidate division Zixibacteria bacterium]